MMSWRHPQHMMSWRRHHLRHVISWCHTLRSCQILRIHAPPRRRSSARRRRKNDTLTSSRRRSRNPRRLSVLKPEFFDKPDYDSPDPAPGAERVSAEASGARNAFLRVLEAAPGAERVFAEASGAEPIPTAVANSPATINRIIIRSAFPFLACPFLAEAQPIPCQASARPAHRKRKPERIG